MDVKLKRSYKKNGHVVFVYTVKGSAEDLARYKKIQGKYYREDEDKNPLWFTIRCIGVTGKLIITSNNKIAPDMSVYDQAASLTSQYGGNFGQELAKAAAQAILSNNPATASAPTTSAQPEEVLDNDVADV